ncbi:MAG: Fis family transcriptional regulator [Deltaproteobacteria bacterium]|nr:Fis family transcriptional regulator [Deltaproteobacteria bacterium]
MKNERLLIIDDELSIRELLEILFEQDGYHVQTVGSAEEGFEILRSQKIDLVLSDLNLPKMSGLELLKKLKKENIETDFIMMTAYGSTENAIEAMKKGASNYVLKPFNNDELRLVVQRALGVQALEQENRKLKEGQRLLNFGYLVGSSSKMNAVYDLVRKVKDSKINCMIVGESGTGKEMVARSIHHAGLRKEHPFIAINCGAIPENLVESELFGHKKGAFTGAIRNKIGLIQAASGGTLFLDEVDALPLSAQVKLLRVLQERRVTPVGDISETSVDVRIIAASNSDLEMQVRQSLFREDLYYRLNVVEIALPALRERGEDVVELSRFFMDKYAREYGKSLIGIAPDALDRLRHFPFPGNVRELQNLIERAVALSVGNVLQKRDFPDHAQGSFWKREEMDPLSFPEDGVHLDAMISELEKKWLISALDKAKGKKGKAAELLHMTFRSFRYRLTKHGLD